MNTVSKRLVSLIIPVHNAGKYLTKRMEDILRQDYPAVEVILVENGSKDNTWEICDKLTRDHGIVRAIQNSKNGTSWARKRGVEEAKGELILFSDQDDCYAHDHAITDMVRAIEEDGSQICQFSHYNQYFPGLRRKRPGNRQHKVYSRIELMSGAIAGVFGQPDGIFDTTVWSKIYDAKVLKKAVQNIDHTLLYAEDMYLNMWAFCEEGVQTVSVRPDAYYVWNTGIGFSGSAGSSLVLFREYEHIKKLTEFFGQKYELPEELVIKCHIETLYFHKNLVQQMIDAGVVRHQVVETIEEIEKYSHLHVARQRVMALPNDKIWDELQYMAQSHTAEEFYDWCIAHKLQESKKDNLLKLLNCFRKR